MVKEYRPKKHLRAVQWLGNNIDEINEFLKYEDNYVIDKDTNIIYLYDGCYESRVMIGDYITYEEEKFGINAIVYHYTLYTKEEFEGEFEEVN